MGKSKRCLGMVATIFSLIAPFGSASGETLMGPSHFSALVLSTFGGQTTRAKFYIDGQKIRIEPEVSGSAISGTYEILDQGEKTLYVVMPAQHMCMKQGLSPQTEAQVRSFQNNAEKDTTVTVLGKETVDGHPTVVRKIVYHAKGQTTTTVKIWNALDMKNVPVKEVIDSENGVRGTILYREISLSKPDPALFIVPPHCGDIPGIGSFGSMIPHLPSGSQLHFP
ncbi:MAG: DUF4412 domain-containing protein [Leptospirales bacterium]